MTRCRGSRALSAGLDAHDDIFRFGSGDTDTLSTYELELNSQSAQFSVLGAGNGSETHVVHGAVLFPGNWWSTWSRIRERSCNRFPARVGRR